MDGSKTRNPLYRTWHHFFHIHFFLTLQDGVFVGNEWSFSIGISVGFYRNTQLTEFFFDIFLDYFSRLWHNKISFLVQWISEVKEKSPKNESGKPRGGYSEKVLKAEKFKTGGESMFEGKIEIMKNENGKHEKMNPKCIKVRRQKKEDKKMSLKPSYLSLILLFVFMIANMSKIPLYSEIYSTVYGKVLDEKTGKGVKGVEVKIFTEFTSKGTITDEKGEFTFYEVEPGGISIMFLPPAPYARPYFSNRYKKCILERGKNLYIVKKLKYGGTIEGRIYEVRTGLPIQEDDIYHLEVDQQLPPFCEIDINGNFRIDQLATGKCTLIVMIKGFGMREIKDIEINKMESTRIDIAFDLSSTNKITGKITCNKSGNSVTNLLVNLRNENLNTATYTNNEGTYVFYDVLPGEYEIFITGVNMDEIETEKKYINFKKKVTVLEEKTSNANLTVDCSLDFPDFKEVLK
jgi:hypothetical protein